MAFLKRIHGRSLAAALPGLLALSALGGCSSDDGAGDGDGGASGGGAGGSGPTESANWTMLGYDAASTYWNRGETKVNRDTAGSLAHKWTIDLGGNVNSAPLQVDGTIYVGSQSTPARTVAIDIESQNILWERDILASSTHAYDDGTVYIHEFGGTLFALDANSGQDKWTLRTTDQAVGTIGFSSPTIANDLILIGGSNLQEILPGTTPTFRGFVWAANKNTQQMAWNTYMVEEGQTGASLWSSVSADVSGGTVYAGTGNNYLDPGTDTSDAIIELAESGGGMNWVAQRYEGDTWSLANPGPPDWDFGANPIVFEAEVDGAMKKLVACGQKSGDFHVLDRDADGAEVAKRNLSGGSPNGAAGIFNNGGWDGTHLLVAANEAGAATMFALTPKLDIVWEKALPGPVMAPVTTAGGVVFVPADNHLLAFNTDTGEQLLDYTAESTIASAPTISDGRVAFGQGIQWSVGSIGSKVTVLEIP